MKRQLDTSNGLLNKSVDLIKLIEKKQRFPMTKIETNSGLTRSQTFINVHNPAMLKTATSAFKIESTMAKLAKINKASQPVDESQALR